MGEKKVERALVLSGGSIKGAFQAGAIAEVLESGFVPDAIYGTSVGSLNGGFLAERAGRAVNDDEEPDWRDIGQDLEEFWLEKLESPDQVIRKRRALELLRGLVRSKFDGLTDTSPLVTLVAEQFKPDNLRACPIPFYACAVNLATGDAEYATPDYSGILEYIIASTAIPIEMPTRLIGQSPYVDGGVREIAPLKKAIVDGATEIVCIICQPEKLQGVSFDPGSLMEFALRLMDVISNELVNNDVERFDKVNAWLQEYEQVQTKLLDLFGESRREQEAKAEAGELLEKLRGKWRPIKLTVIRPENEIVLDILHFTRTEIAEIIKQGRNAAQKVLASKPPEEGEAAAPAEGEAAGGGEEADE
jgi:NTE family protein